MFVEQPIRIGCAGWSIPAASAARFPDQGTHLQRYAHLLPAVEINSSFYRPHKPATYERWANSVPEDFLFCIKVPKLITHTLRLKKSEDALHAFLSECTHLGTKLGALLVQLPPTLAFEYDTATSFFTTLRGYFSGNVACEPRHATWFAPEPDRLLSTFQISRVAADPTVALEATRDSGQSGDGEEITLAQPGGWPGMVYYRLHGSPRIYYSAYQPQYLHAVAKSLVRAREQGSQAWCIFDNTAEGAATEDALTVLDYISTAASRNPSPE